ncbi:MAG: PSD1 and planctomycete cytochrome C domain-containing protein [Acidobacteriota bacterium]|nr:PSD1 and planctomycete cytochrome C domain-containing protein [Acidobacteriota bacterium]
MAAKLKLLVCCLWVIVPLAYYSIDTLPGAKASARDSHRSGPTTTHALSPTTSLFQPQEKSDKKVDFNRDIKPIFETSCNKCHGDGKATAGLRLDSKAAAMKGGGSGPAIVAGNSKGSLLMQRVRGEGNEMRMPPGKELPPEKIDLLAAWIDEGAAWPDEPAAATAIERSAPPPSSSTQSPIQPSTASSSPTAGGAVVVADAQKVDFVRDVQPIFQASCYSCHAGEKPKAQLRLDAKTLAMKGGISGPVILPGNSEGSRLVHRVLGLHNETRMPLKADPLSSAQIAVIRRWIDEGAAWPDDASVDGAKIKTHWAFIAPVRPPLPPIKNRAWVQNPVDCFILARLEREQLTPSPAASKETLARRLSLDLTGLPPTIAEVDRFLVDRSPDAYEKLVERLLSSPHYGERWGRHWLDAARYADSDGYEKDKTRQVWFYRDWVINALNRDLPYDRFIIEQLAGDLLPGAAQEQVVATGFLRNSMVNEEGGVDPEQFRMEAMFDRMDAIGKSVLGITIQCAQCHTHKYDPIKHDEYYRMFAFLNNSHEANVSVYTPEEQIKRAEIFRRTREIEADLQHRTSDWQARMAAWEETAKRDQPEWIVVRPTVDDISTGGQKYVPLKDGSLLAQGYAPTKHKAKMTLKTDTQNVSAIRLELLNDPNLPLGGPGRSIKGTGALTEFEVEAAPASAPDKVTKLKIVRAIADVALPEQPLEAIFDDKSKKQRVTGPIAFAIDGKDETAWGIDAGPGLRNQPRKAVFTLESPVANEGGTIFTFYLKQNHGGWNSDDNQTHNLGRVRLSITTAPNASADQLPQSVRDILAVPRESRTPAQTHALFGYWRTTVTEWQEANQQISELWRQHPEGSTQMVLQDRDDARATYLLARGDFLKPSREVNPGVPAFLHQLPPGATPNRLTFARWLVDRNSPTTARAKINRVWQSYFGTGLVSTPEDFGKQSEAPSHPELLDWLAVELMDKNWSLKSLHRLIVTSATYRQSSKVTPELYTRDPDNRLLARGPRLRVEAETVRDIALAASGLLNPRVGGPSVFPPAPDFLFQPPVSYGPKIWDEAKGDDRYRRALYTFRYRSVPYPMLQIFDAPNGDVSCVRRARSNTPLQALTTLNEPLFLETARALALLTLKEGGATDTQRLAYAFRRTLARRPTAPESAELLTLLSTQQRRFAAGELNPWNLATNDPDKPQLLTKGATMEQLAAWTVVSRVLLNLDETITKE